MLEKYVSLLEKNFLPKIDFKIHDFVLFSYEDLNRLFLYEYRNLPFMKRINEIKKSLVVIIPSYLVKGLEFDIVIVANASKENYTERDLDVKLLYVAMTRPLHKLYIYSLGEKSRMLCF